MNPKLIVLLLLPPLLGALFLTRFFQQSRMPLKTLFTVLASTATGYALISFGLFLCYVLQPHYARLLTAVLPWFLVLGLLIRLAGTQTTPQACSLKQTLRQCFFGGWNSPQQILHSILSWFLIALLIYTLINSAETLAGYMTWNAFGGWDARYFWVLKARFLFRDPEQWRLMFSEWIASWGNHDYPLMVPGVMAWGWNFMGRESLLWPMIISGVFMFSLGGLMVWYLAAWRSWPAALAAALFFFTLPAYQFWAGTLYNDIPYAFFSNGALLLLITALRQKEMRLFALAGFFAGCAAWTKNEGIIFLGWFGLLAGVSLIHERRISHKTVWPALGAIAGGMVIPLLICLYFKLALVGRETHLIKKSTPAEFWAALTNWPRNQVIVQGFRMYMADYKNWHGLWFLFAAAVVYWPVTRKVSPRPYSGLIILAIVLIHLGYAFVFTQTPNNIYKHIETALMRLLLHTSALAVVFIFETFGMLRPNASISSPPS